MASETVLPLDPVAGLIDIPLPDPISLWPQTFVSRTVVVLAVVALGAALVRFLYLWHVNRYRRAALADLDRILSKKGDDAPAQFAFLVRRTALAVFPREKIADLSGSEWLAFLDRSYGGQGFSSDAGRALSSAPYAPLQGATVNTAAVADLVRRWIRMHHV